MTNMKKPKISEKQRDQFNMGEAIGEYYRARLIAFFRRIFTRKRA